jgi:hypothetical protein
MEICNIDADTQLPGKRKIREFLSLEVNPSSAQDKLVKMTGGTVRQLSETGFRVV